MFLRFLMIALRSLSLSLSLRGCVWSILLVLKWSEGFFSFALSSYYFRAARTVCLKDEWQSGDGTWVRRLEKGAVGLVRLPAMVDSWCEKSPWLSIHGDRWDQATSSEP
jgi:hypothetical protein